VIKSELVERLSVQNPRLYRRDCEKIVSTIFADITAAMARPRTGALVLVGRKAVPFFRTGKEMKSRLNSLGIKVSAAVCGTPSERPRR